MIHVVAFAELEKEKADLLAELATYKSLNITLQQNLNEVLQRAFSKTGPSLLNRPSASFESKPDGGPDELPNSSEGNNPPLNKNTSQSTLSLYEIKDGTIHIGENIWIREEVWRKMTSTTKDSLFVKEMAVALWGTATLQRRSVSGKECPTNRHSQKPPLTPSKLHVLRVSFSDWLKQKEPERGEREKRGKQVWHYISQKLQDIIKKRKKK
ncbi:BEN domain-containing protein 5-like [Carassius auratus]|uniref:BEN domain-containing protein 5-like n=1 Tax=Carassius auratus TaxID=7957 RepID=A0A6P6P3D6_CARAU|nr:BEN domain-containing protein 5-like [Carassius auratus]